MLIGIQKHTEDKFWIDLRLTHLYRLSSGSNTTFRMRLYLLDNCSACWTEQYECCPAVSHTSPFDDEFVCLSHLPTSDPMNQIYNIIYCQVWSQLLRL